jgi:hypothetical protein
MLTGIGWFIREEEWIRQKDWFRGWRNGWGVELLLKQNHIKGGTYGKVRRDHQI